MNRGLPRINFRIFLLAAVSLIFGIFLYFRIAFGGVLPSDFLFFGLFFLLILPPFDKKRLLCIGLALLLFGGAGAGLSHLYTARYQSGKEAGEYTVTGTVVSFTVKNGYSSALLDELMFDGAKADGLLRASITSEEVRAGDIIAFECNVKRNGLPMSENDAYEFYRDIRYTAYVTEYRAVDVSKNFLLRLNSALYDRLKEDLGGTEAEVAFALLTGNSSALDEGLSEEIRAGGIAHIFAVSGLHIGILFGAALLIFKKLGRKAYFPAIALAVLYTAFCSFTVSSVRAVLMCAVLGAYRMRGRKYDFLESISLAALIILLINPADWLSTGFRLSFGACVALALFAGPLTRVFRKIKLPARLAGYLGGNLSVQLFTAPILLETFGYFSAWGFLLNLVLIPLLPVLFLTVLLSALLALIIPPAGFVFLIPAKGVLSLLLFVFAAEDFSWVVTGFSLGAGLSLFVAGSTLLSGRVRMKGVLRAVLTGVVCVLFAAVVTLENVVFMGGKGVVYEGRSGYAALIETRDAHVLLLGGASYADCRTFLSHRYGGTLDAVLVLSEDELDGINVAAFLETEDIYARDAIGTGFTQTEVTFAERVDVKGLLFTFETRDKVSLQAEGVVVEFDFAHPHDLGADLFVGDGAGGLIFFFGNGIIKVL